MRQAPPPFLRGMGGEGGHHSQRQKSDAKPTVTLSVTTIPCPNDLNPLKLKVES